MAVIRQRTQVFNQPVGVVRAEAGEERLAASISNAADTMAQMAFRDAADDAQKRGVDIALAVEDKRLRTIDPETGKPEPFKAPEGFGRIAATAYQQVIDKRFEDSVNTELQTKAKEFAQKYEYNPDAYDEMFSDYIAAMGKNAEGKYKTFIESTGSKYLALTKLNIQEKARARARANLAASISTSIDQNTGKAYEIARAGGFIARTGEEQSEAASVRDREVSAAANAISSGLFKAGTDVKARTQLNENIAKGGVEYILTAATNKAERDALALAIRTRGAQMDGLPSGLKSEVKEILKYVEPSNVETVLRHVSVVSGDYNAVEANIIAQQKAQAAADSRVMDLQLEDTIENLGDISSGLSIYGFHNRDETGALMPFAVSASLQQAAENYSTINNNLEQRYLSDSNYSKTELGQDRTDARRAALRPFVVQAASEGNVEALKTALISADPRDLAKLTDTQLEFVRTVRSSELYDSIDDKEFVNGVLSASQNSLRDEADRMQLQYQIAKDVTQAGELANQGALTEDQFSQVISNIRKNIGPRGLTAEQASKQESRLRSQYGIGAAAIFAASASSQDLNGLERYIDTNGEDTRGVSPSAIEAGNQILAATETKEEVDAVVSKVKGLRAAVAQAESESKLQAEKQQIAQSILSGTGNANDPQYRKVSQEMIESANLDITQFNQYTPEQQQQIVAIARSAPPQNLVDGLQQIASGQMTKGADSLLDIFAQLETDMTEPFGTSVSLTTKEFLRDVNTVRTMEGGNIQEIAVRLNKARRDEGKANLTANLSGKTVTEFTADILDNVYGSVDPVIADELAPLVEYHGMSGKSADAIMERVEQFVEQRYAKSEYIVDPMRPVGSIFRSRYSLAAVFPDEDTRSQFLTTVESQLPSGYSLFPDTYKAAVALAQTQGMATDEMREKAIMNKVYLMPIKTTGKPQYLAQFVDENNELRPLIYEKDGQMVYPMFSEEDIKPYLDQKAAERQAEIEAELDKQERSLEVLRRRPRMQ